MEKLLITFEKYNSLAFRNRGIIYLNFGNFDKACSDLLISKNLNPRFCKKALRKTVHLLRSKPVAIN